jgi:hypothetical protein
MPGKTVGPFDRPFQFSHHQQQHIRVFWRKEDIAPGQDNAPHPMRVVFRKVRSEAALQTPNYTGSRFCYHAALRFSKAFRSPAHKAQAINPP